MTQQQNSGNPNWKSILEKIPAEYHSQVMPTLQEWDQAVQSKFQEIHKQYEPYKGYKALVDNNIAPDYVENAVMLADQFQKDPNLVIKQANDAWNLGILTKAEADALRQSAAGNPNSTANQDDPFGSDSDLNDDPRVKALAAQVETMRKEFTETREQQAQRENEEAWDNYLDELEEHCETEKLPFNRMFVDAMLQQGMTGEAAIQQYHQVLGAQVVQNQQAAAQQPPANAAPPVMGSGGTVGAGVSDGTIDFAGMKKTDLNKSIEQILAAAQESGQG